MYIEKMYIRFWRKKNVHKNPPRSGGKFFALFYCRKKNMHKKLKMYKDFLEIQNVHKKMYIRFWKFKKCE